MSQQVPVSLSPDEWQAMIAVVETAGYTHYHGIVMGRVLDQVRAALPCVCGRKVEPDDDGIMVRGVAWHVDCWTRSDPYA